jgi:Zn-dependent M28 family amino/carboxypeptidase
MDEDRTQTRPPGSGDGCDALVTELRRDIAVLAEEIGPRHAWRPAALDRAAEHIAGELSAAGHEVRSEVYHLRGQAFRNLVVEVPGGDEIALVGAHYDTVSGGACPGANDNGSGVAAVLALARRFAGARPGRTLRFVLFANEEPPFFLTEGMGSRVHARRARERGEHVAAMLSLETIAYYSDEPGSQRYPPMLARFYPTTGNFLAFVGNLRSRSLVREACAAFRRGSELPVESAALPSWLPGVGWSDHWSFWKEGWRAAMVTDTAPYRYPWYHADGDTLDRLDLDRMALAVKGLEAVVAQLARVPAAAD